MREKKTFQMQVYKNRQKMLWQVADTFGASSPLLDQLVPNMVP